MGHRLYLLSKEGRLIKVKYANSTHHTFYGRKEWLGKNEDGKVFILPEHEPNPALLVSMDKTKVEIQDDAYSHQQGQAA
jgi:hypothetical protein